MVDSSTPALQTRRRTLGALAAGTAAAVSGCTRRLRSVVGWRSRRPVSLEISTVPADADPYALRIARQIAEWFDAAGIETAVTPMDDEGLLRQVLLNHDYDVFVGKLSPGLERPDDLYPLLHSQYADAPGWQNPFGYANLEVDDNLERQRRVDGTDRRSAVTDVLSTLAKTQPFTTIARHEDVHAARTTRFENWAPERLDSPRGYLALERSTADSTTLRVAVTDGRMTANLNPLSVEFRRSGPFVGLLYDALGSTNDDDAVEPWLAEGWSFSVDGRAPTATVDLREDLRWHDGKALTAEDVAFTFSLLQDTSGQDSGEEESDTVPAPRYRGRSSLVESVTVEDPETAIIEFVECMPRVAASALTLPVLPEHIWADRRERASVSGIEVGAVTEAIVTDNVPAVGSGPLEFVRAEPGDTLVLERYDDHFLTRDDVMDVPESMQGGPAFDRLTVQPVGSDTTAIDLVREDEADLTQTPVSSRTVPRIGRANELELLVSAAEVPYVVGYNVQRAPLSNSRFRNTLVRLVDKAHLAEATFEGYATPAASPLARTPWLPAELEWDDGHPVTPFLGEDGQVDVEKARAAFQEAGFQYEDETLVQTD